MKEWSLNKRCGALMLCASALNMIDAVMTYIMVGIFGYIEINPLMNFVMQKLNINVFMIIKIVLSLWFLHAGLKTWDGKEVATKTDFWIGVFVNCMFIFVILWSFF